MKYTNIHGYPAPFVRAVTADTYDRGESDYTISELITPPRLSLLLKRHDDEVTIDVSERLYVLDGIVAHEILARGGGPGELTEERLYAKVAEKIIGGKPDTLCLDESHLLTDYKRTTVWAYVFGKPDWVSQLNAYAFLARENGHEVKDLEIFAMFRDWSESRSLGSNDYPKTNCLRIPIPLWTPEETQVWLAGRILEHERAKDLEDDKLPICTAEERWEKPTTWAIMKPGRKSALSLHESEADAWKSMKEGLTVQVRPGKSTRCESYCSAAPFCSFAKSLKPTPTEAEG